MRRSASVCVMTAACVALLALAALCPPTVRTPRDGRKDHYKALRKLSAAKLWEIEVPKFNRLGSDAAREQQVAVVRAVGVKLANADGDRKVAARAWLRGLLRDSSSEKVRRYAAAASSKLGGGGSDELLLSLLRTGESARERESAAAALAETGSDDAVAAAVEAVSSRADGYIEAATASKLRARVARAQSSAISLAAAVPASLLPGLRLHLRCRRGLEATVADEVREDAERGGTLALVEVRDACVVVEAAAGDVEVRLADVYRLRCFDTAGFVLWEGAELSTDAVAAAVGGDRCEALLRALTDGGSLRYRLRFVDAGGKEEAPQPTAAIKRAAEAAYRRRPSVVNDPRQAIWCVDAVRGGDGRDASVELRPRPSPNPRLFYRTATFYAGAHPPLAASMARMAALRRGGGRRVVYDPFCGSGMELIEVALADAAAAAAGGGGGGGSEAEAQELTLVGTDIDAAALAVAEANLAAAHLGGGVAHALAARDFRDALDGEAALPLAAGEVDAIVSNPPLGQRVKVANLHALFADLFRLSATLLRPGRGRLVVVNPLRAAPPDAEARRRLELVGHATVDLGLRRDCRVEVWRRTEGP